MSEFSLVGLRVVREIAISGSFSAAAERLGYTQSAVSRQVALMERAAGHALFVRHARGARPTEAGELLMRHAATALAELEGARHELADLAGTARRRLRVGAFSTALAALVPQAMALFGGWRGRVEVLLSEGTSPGLLSRVAAGRLDLAVVTAPSDPVPGVRVEKLLDDTLLVAVDRRHPLAGRRSATTDSLRSQKWVAASAERSTLLGSWTESSWEPQIAYLTKDWTAKLGVVAAGLAVTIVPALALPMLPASVIALPIKDVRASRQVAVVTRSAAGEDAYRSMFIDALREVAARLAT